MIITAWDAHGWRGDTLTDQTAGGDTHTHTQSVNIWYRTVITWPPKKASGCIFLTWMTANAGYFSSCSLFSHSPHTLHLNVGSFKQNFWETLWKAPGLASPSKCYSSLTAALPSLFPLSGRTALRWKERIWNTTLSGCSSLWRWSASYPPHASSKITTQMAKHDLMSTKMKNTSLTSATSFKLHVVSCCLIGSQWPLRSSWVLVWFPSMFEP